MRCMYHVGIAIAAHVYSWSCISKVAWIGWKVLSLCKMVSTSTILVGVADKNSASGMFNLCVSVSFQFKTRQRKHYSFFYGSDNEICKFEVTCWNVRNTCCILWNISSSYSAMWKWISGFKKVIRTQCIELEKEINPFAISEKKNDYRHKWWWTGWQSRFSVCAVGWMS